MPLFASPPWETQTLWCHNNWSLNYSGKVRERGRLIHHLGEARRSQLAAVSSVALQGRHFEITMQSRRSLPTSQWEPLVSLRAARFLCIRKETAALYFWVANWVVTKHLCHTKDNIVFFNLSTCSFSFSLVIYMCFYSTISLDFQQFEAE